MSDTKDANTQGGLGLSAAIVKLMDTVSNGIGQLYEPIHIRRMAKARAKELELIGNAMSQNIHLPTKYEDGKITIDATNANELIRRMQNRLLFQEMKKQQNIDSVVDHAYGFLEEVSHVSTDPVDEDWVNAFFNSVENVSTEQMQIIWGKLLAGEVQRPGSFSLRTLSILKNLTQKEAVIFKEIAPLVLHCKCDNEGLLQDYFLMNNKDDDLLENKYDIPFLKILRLSEAGLISDNTFLSFDFELKPTKTEFIYGINKAIEFVNLSDTSLRVRHSAYVLTEAGKELLQITCDNDCTATSNEFIKDCLEEIKQHGIHHLDSPVTADNVSIRIVDC